jgi:hypothetical protein
VSKYSDQWISFRVFHDELLRHALVFVSSHVTDLSVESANIWIVPQPGHSVMKEGECDG